VSHLAILPILLPALSGILMLLPPLAARPLAQRWIAWIGLVALMVTAGVLLHVVTYQTQIYVLGDWQPPFGIMLLVDRLAALLLTATAVLAFCACLYGEAQGDRPGHFFYPLFMFQIMGINGAFLTGDIFNLFVFFEVLLIASYALLVHGGGKEKTKAGFQYVTLNLLGSAFFLIALGTLYGTLGTLNMADMAVKVSGLSPEEQAIARAGGLLLLLVFGLKSAMLPLQFWLPQTYSAASAPVAALFAIMTKVGLYSIYRVFGGIFGSDAGSLAHIATPWIWPLAISTLVVGSCGAFAAPSLRLLTANMVIASAGTLLLSFVINDGQSLSAGLFYLLHSTAVAGALFLIADQIRIQRGPAQDRFVISKPMHRAGIIGSFFFIGAIGAIGLPPLSGFVAKALLLQSATRLNEQLWVWPALLISSLIALVAFSRAGTAFFWHVSGNKKTGVKARPNQVLAISILLTIPLLMTFFADPIVRYSQRAADDIRHSTAIVQQRLQDDRNTAHAEQ
jgi:multicomponent K+:H+ antiporter subunit D